MLEVGSVKVVALVTIPATAGAVVVVAQAGRMTERAVVAVSAASTSPVPKAALRCGLLVGCGGLCGLLVSCGRRCGLLVSSDCDSDVLKDACNQVLKCSVDFGVEGCISRGGVHCLFDETVGFLHVEEGSIRTTRLIGVRSENSLAVGAVDCLISGTLAEAKHMECGVAGVAGLRRHVQNSRVEGGEI